MDTSDFETPFCLRDNSRRLLNLFEPSSEFNETLNCLLDHKKVNDGKNIKLCYAKNEKHGSKYLANVIAHLDNVHKVSIQMIRNQSTVTSGSKMFNLTKEPQKETVQVFLRERSRLRGDTVSPLFEYLTTETSNEFVLYELLSPYTFITLKFFTVDLRKKIFICRMEHKHVCTFKATLAKETTHVYCLFNLKEHIRHRHKITLASLKNMVKEGCSTEIKSILEGPLVSLNYSKYSDG